MIVKYIFNKTTEVNPINRDKIFLQINYDQQAIINQAVPHVGVTNLVFRREDVAVFFNAIKATGIFYAPTFDIVMEDKGNIQTIPMYFDLTNGLKMSRDGTEVSIKMYQSIDWLNDRCNGFSFEALFNRSDDDKKIFTDKNIYIPYVVSSVPNYTDSIIAMGSIFTISMQVYQGVNTLVKDSVAVPVVAAEVAASATVVLAPAAAPVAVYHTNEIIVDIIFLLLLIIALFIYILQLINTLIQPTKYHAGMLLIDMLKITCEELGLPFSSTIFDTFPFNSVVYIPQKFQPPPALIDFALYGIKGYQSPDDTLQRGYMMGTGGDLFSICKSLVNGKIVITPNVAGINTLNLERRDWNLPLPKYTMPDVRMDWNGYNASEIYANIILRFQKDLNDKNTIDNYAGQIFQSQVMCISAPDPSLSLLKGERMINIPAARGIRKDKYSVPSSGFTLPEELLAPIFDIINVFLSAVDAVASLLNTFAGTNLSATPITNPITARIGMLLLENDMVDTPKLILISNEDGSPIDGSVYQKSRDGKIRLHPDNSKIINAGYLWDKFYCIDSPVPFATGNGVGNGPSGVVGYANVGDIGKHNQYTLWTPSLNRSSERNNVQFIFADWLKLKDDSKFNANFADGNNEVIADSIGWHYKESWADISLRRNEQYDFNLTVINTLPNGQ